MLHVTMRNKGSSSNKRVKSLHNSSNRPTVFTVGEPKSVGPTKFPQQKRESNCWGAVGEPKNVGPNSFPPTNVLKVCWEKCVGSIQNSIFFISC